MEAVVGTRSSIVTGGRIVVVEDDVQIARLEKLHLEGAGHEVTVVRTLDELLRRLHIGPADLLVLDIELDDGVNGMDLYLRVRDSGYEVPAILVSGRHTPELLIRALRAGIRDVLPKSTAFIEHLGGVIDRVLRQVRIERRLVESESRLASVVGSALDAILVAGSDFRITLMNAAAERMFRCTMEEGLGRLLGDFLPAECLAPPPPGTPLPRILQNSVRARRADGDRFPVEVSFSRSDGNAHPFYTSVVRDITERERADAKIREQAALLDQANDAIVVRDHDGRVMYWNRGAERLYGWTAGEAQSDSLGDTLTSTAFRSLVQSHLTLSEAGQWSGELRHVGRDGVEVIAASRWSLLRGPGRLEAGILVIDSDVTAQKQLEMQYLHSQKMQAVGQLAGGVAHDFNNLLTVVMGTAEILLERKEWEPETTELVSAIHRAAERGAALIRQLLSYSRRYQNAPRPVDVNRVVGEVQEMIPRLIGTHISLVTSLAPDVGRVIADPSQLEQVLMNLIVNARDAMPGGGTLTLETQSVEVDVETAKRLDLRAGPYVRLMVADTGTGMDAETLQRAFEPFFTTKGPGLGTGLGLATVHGIVRQASGALDVLSEPGNGSTFLVFLPKAARRESVQAAADSPALRGTETLLVVDDDDSVLATFGLILRDLGYRVMLANGGPSALSLLERERPDLDLLITDIMMPEMNGAQLADRILADRPGLPVMFVSGYAPEGTLGERLEQPRLRFLQKPFTRDVLAATVRCVIDARIAHDENSADE